MVNKKHVKELGLVRWELNESEKPWKYVFCEQGTSDGPQRWLDGLWDQTWKGRTDQS